MNLFEHFKYNFVYQISVPMFMIKGLLLKVGYKHALAFWSPKYKTSMFYTICHVLSSCWVSLLSFDVELVKWQMQSPVQYPANFSWGLRGLHHFIGRVPQNTEGVHLSLEFPLSLGEGVAGLGGGLVSQVYPCLIVMLLVVAHKWTVMVVQFSNLKNHFFAFEILFDRLVVNHWLKSSGIQQ